MDIKQQILNQIEVSLSASSKLGASDETIEQMLAIKYFIEALSNAEITFEELAEDHKEFALKKFPDSTYDSSLRGLEREIKEVESATMDYYVIDGQKNRKALVFEFADCFMYLLDSMNRLGISMEELKKGFADKMKINKDREWKKNNDGSYSHVK